MYALDKDRRLTGVISLRQLLLSELAKRLSEVMTSSVWSVNVHADQEDVARQVSRYNILLSRSWTIRAPWWAWSPWTM